MNTRMILLGALAALGMDTYGLDIDASVSMGGVYEKGECTTAAAPMIGVGLSLAQRAGPGDAVMSLDAFAGAMVGEVLGFKAGIGYCPDFGGIWRPSLKAVASMDFGSRLVVRSGATPLLRSPYRFLGLELSPLRLELGDETISALEATVALAPSEGPATWRFELGVFRFQRRLGGVAVRDRLPSRVDGPSLSATWGLDYNLFGSLPGGLSPLSLGGGLAWEGLELDLGLTSLAHEASSFASQWMQSAAVGYGPAIGPWRPSIGLGFLHAYTGYVYDGYTIHYLDSCAVSTVFMALKPLRFHVPLVSGTSLVASALELRISPIFPTAIREKSEPSYSALSVSLLRVGLNFDF